MGITLSDLIETLKFAAANQTESDGAEIAGIISYVAAYCEQFPECISPADVMTILVREALRESKREPILMGTV